MDTDRIEAAARECVRTFAEHGFPMPNAAVDIIAALVRREVERAVQPWVDATRNALALDEDAPCSPEDVHKIALAELVEVSQGVARLHGVPTFDQVECEGASAKDGGPFIWKSQVGQLLNDRSAAIRARGDGEKGERRA